MAEFCGIAKTVVFCEKNHPVDIVRKFPGDTRDHMFSVSYTPEREMPNTINLPFSPEDIRTGRVARHVEEWDKWYASLPDDLRRKLSINDFKRLGECFKVAFDIDGYGPRRA